MRELRIVIADDHPLMVLSAEAVVEGIDGVEIVGEARSADEVLPTIEASQPDLVVLSLGLRDFDGFACLERIRSEHPNVAVIVSAADDPSVIERAIALGAHGFMTKSATPSEFADAIDYFAQPKAFRIFGARSADRSELTDRELAVVQAVARGLSNKEIARELWITEQTVKFHLGNIFRKLAVANRTEAARVVFERGLDSASHEPPAESIRSRARIAQSIQ